MNYAIRLLAAALAVLPVAALADGAPAPLTPETMWQLKRVGAPAISPDGKFAVYDLKRYDAENDKGDSDLYLVPTAGGKPRRLTSSKGNETNPPGARMAASSPSSRSAATTSSRSST
jgi:dipeptidyl aminopeptidase/acylaminoacyl peptidase